MTVHVKNHLCFLFSFYYPKLYRINTTQNNISPFLLSLPLLSISSSFYLLFFLSPLLSISLHSILKVTLTPFHLWPWKSAFRWPPLSRLLILLRLMHFLYKRYPQVHSWAGGIHVCSQNCSSSLFLVSKIREHSKHKL